MPGRRRSLQIKDDTQRAALRSPVRIEILEHLALMGPASVRDLADRMGSSPHALHYHVRQLRDVGLLRVTGSRKSGSRDEALYDAVADRLEISADGEGGGESVGHAARSILRRAERKFAAVADTAPERLEAGDGFAGLSRARISKTAHKEVVRHIKAIEAIFAEEFRREPPPQARTEMYGFTYVLCPEE
jgi:DNA-binding transcriptional ArsR family regulator